MQVIDAAMVDGVSYLSSFVLQGISSGFWRNELDKAGTNLLDSGAHFYGEDQTLDEDGVA
jgi:alpha-methylacyl-CoA racemase